MSDGGDPLQSLALTLSETTGLFESMHGLSRDRRLAVIGTGPRVLESAARRAVDAGYGHQARILVEEYARRSPAGATAAQWRAVMERALGAVGAGDLTRSGAAGSPPVSGPEWTACPGRSAGR